jgi:hypothetical protein
MLALPTGQILYTRQSNQVQVYTPSGSADLSWRPSITSVPSTLTTGQTYQISGLQFNGLTQGAYYGDDQQSASNYPLVRLTNQATGHIRYARTHDHSSMAVATGPATVSTSFDVPANAETGATDVEVVANGIASAKVTVTITGTLSAPTVTGIAPTSGPAAGGTGVTITGTNFVSGTTVSIGGVAATSVVIQNATTITATTGAHTAGTVSVVVTNPDTQSGTLTNGYTYKAPPSVTAILPNTGSTAGGTNVTISGSNFVTGATVSIGGVAATSVVVVSAGSITATTGAHAAGPVSVVVTNPDTQSGALANGFTYTAPLSAPTVTSVSPNKGTRSGGTSVTVTGTNFVNGATVSFGGVSATSVTFVSATGLTAVTPAHVQGSVSVAVTNPDGQTGTQANGYTYNRK